MSETRTVDRLDLVRLGRYVVAQGPMHDDHCPGDDTCDCSWAPTLAAVNRLCAIAERSEPAAASVPLSNCICPTTYAHGMIIPIADGDCQHCFPKPAAPAVSREAEGAQDDDAQTITDLPATLMQLAFMSLESRIDEDRTVTTCSRYPPFGTVHPPDQWCRACHMDWQRERAMRQAARALSSAPGEREGR
jgi:hypothetical protein